VILFDNHLHLRRDGRYLEAAREFQHAGGTHLVLIQYPMPGTVLKEQRYQTCYQETLSMAAELQTTLGLTVFIVVGPYPVDYLTLREHLGREHTLSIMRKGMDEAAALCEEHKAIAIGEIGRPHFPVDDQAWTDANDILLYGMQKAKDAHVPVVLHTESTTPTSCKEFVEMGKKAGLPADKIVKHFSPPLITPEENHGLMPSVLSSKKNILTALQKGTRFLMETDYIDDLKRPGAVLGPKTVPSLTKKLLETGVMTEAQASIIHKQNPEKTYDITLEEP